MSKSRLITGVLALLAVVSAAAVVVTLAAASPGHPSLPSPAPAASGRSGVDASARLAAARSPLRVVGVWPKRTVSGRQPITVRVSSTASASAVTLSPRVAGRWQSAGPRTLRFTPAVEWAPYTTLTVSVTGSRRSAASVQTRPAAGQLTDALAGLGYLPGRMADGRFIVAAGWPSSLRMLWGSDPGVVLQGAAISFQAQQGLATDGVAGPRTWAALTRALATHARNRTGISYAVADQHAPETLTVYHDAAVVLRTPANTGVADAPTSVGTFPVYERLRSQIMRGTNPDGSQYADPVQFVSYFHGGEAVHYMPRASYGDPQSLGCVELPYGSAQRAWSYLSLGTLVTVSAS